MLGDEFGSGSVIVSTSELSSMVGYVSVLLHVCTGWAVRLQSLLMLSGTGFCLGTK